MTGTTHGKTKKAFTSSLVTSEVVDGMYQDDPFDSIVRDGVSPEKYTHGKVFEFSIAPADQQLHAGFDSRAAEMVHTWATTLFDKLGDICDYDMIVECATPKYDRYFPDHVNRIHFHGTVTFKTPSSYGRFICERQYLLSRFCTFKISDYRPDVWPQYISKQQYIMEPLLGKLYNIRPPVLVVSAAKRGIQPKAQRGGSGVRGSQRSENRGEPEAVTPISRDHLITFNI